jgi:hypothetical protein
LAYIHDGVVAFPAFVRDKKDPLYIFHDSVAHETCLQQHPLKGLLEQILNDLEIKLAPENRNCFICGRKISNPNDYMAFGCMSSDKNSLLFPLNFQQYHISCFRNSKNKNQIEVLLKERGWEPKDIKKLTEI